MNTSPISLWFLLLTFIASFHVTQNRVLTQEDYTLYFDEYNFDWSNAADWHVITADNTQKNTEGKSYTKIVACTLHMDGVKKNLCVHTKSEGGFTLKFQDFPKEPDARWHSVPSNAAHTDIDNEFESFLRSQSMYYDQDEEDAYNIELDFLNDDDWSEITAIWNWDMDETQQHIRQNQLYQQYAQSLQNMYQTYDNSEYDDDPSPRRRLIGEFSEYDEYRLSDDDFLGFVKRMMGRSGNPGSPRHPKYKWRPPNPMMKMMMEMLKMQMMMAMMRGMMASKSARMGDNNLYYYNDYNNYQYGQYAAAQAYDYGDDLYGNRRRLRKRSRQSRGRQRPRRRRRRAPPSPMSRMMGKMPNMMMNMMMMNMMGNMMKGMNPYLGMMMLGQFAGHGHGRGRGHRSSSHRRRGHQPMPMRGGMMPNRYMMNPMMLGMPGMGMMHPMSHPMMNPMMNPMMMQMMHGMHGKNGGMNPMMMIMMGMDPMMAMMMNSMQHGHGKQGGMGGMNPMMLSMMSGAMGHGMNSMKMDPMTMGLMAGMMAKHPQGINTGHPPPSAPPRAMPHHGAGRPPPMAPPGRMVGSMASMANMGGKANPMFNVNMGYMMGRAVKKCQPLKNGLEICAMYNPTTNQLNVDVKCKNCKKLKKAKPRRIFPKKLSKMIKMLVKQRVFGRAGDQLLGGKLQKRFARYAGLHKKKGPKGAKGAKGAKGPKGPPPAPGAAAPPPGSNGVGPSSFGAHTADNMYEDQDEQFVSFDTMEGNIGYAMWRAELMDWHNWDDYEENTDAMEDELMDYGEYRNFGNFVHYFDSFEANWNDDHNWNDFDMENSQKVIQFGDDVVAMDLGQKCGHKLPFLNFKMCSKVSDDDISVFFKRTADADMSAARMDTESDWYNAYFDDEEYEANDVKTLQSIIEYEFEQSVFRFNNDDDWHEIVTSHPSGSMAHDRRSLMNDGAAIAGERLGEHDHKETEIKLFGHLYRLRGISKCGGGDDSPRFCVGIHLGEEITMPSGVQLPMTKMCNFMYIAKMCLGFDPNRMELKLSIQFQSIHKWKGIAKRILEVIKHLPHKVKRYMKWAEDASSTSAAAKVQSGDVLSYYDDEVEEIVDGWYDDEEDQEWVISSAKVDDVMNEEVKTRQIETITTHKGHEVERKCLHMMGGRLCLCQFLSWMDSPQYHCHPEEGFLMGGIMGGMASAKGIDMNAYDYDGYEDQMYGFGAGNHADMSRYYEIIENADADDMIYDEEDMESMDREASEDGFSARNVYDDDDDMLLYDEEDDDSLYEGYNAYGEDETDENIKDEGEWDAGAFYDANYDESHKEYEHDYAYYFGGAYEEERVGDDRWIQRKDEPQELLSIEHPQQQKHSEHNLFIYNDYNDDITYLKKKYPHHEEEEEEEEEDRSEDANAFYFDTSIEINSNLFWILSLLAVFFGIALCSAVVYYLKKRQQFINEFAKQFEPFIITPNQGIGKPFKYGFTPINVPLTRCDTDDDDASDDDDTPVENGRLLNLSDDGA